MLAPPVFPTALDALYNDFMVIKTQSQSKVTFMVMLSLLTEYLRKS